MSKSSARVLLVCMRNEWTRIAAERIEEWFENVEILFWDYGDPQPGQVLDWSGDWILSFRADWIIPGDVLARASCGSLNFHPAPPEYRGIGSHHYAIFNGDVEFGVTCHHIDERLDAGTIIEVNRFPIAAGETGTSLGQRAAAHCLTQFLDVVTNHVLGAVPLPTSTEKWGRRLYTHASLTAWRRDLERQTPHHPCFQ